MNDVKAIAPGQWQWSGWLTPKGRVIALFLLLKLDEQTLWLVVPDADPAALCAALRRFVFRSKVVLEVRNDLQVEGRFGAPVQAHGHALAADGSGDIELDMGSGHAARCLRITSTSTASVDAHADARWAMHDLEHGLPRLPASQAEHWTPQQLSLERLRAFSVKKGCYPGQEIVARTHFLGKAKRGLILVESPCPLEVGAELRTENTALGNVIATADADGRHLALVVGPLDRESSPLTINGQSVREAALLDGLAR
ncbi:YgfZ/GcvT domain-containing protein [Lysobacter koreensis]|uniref:YgfZ/GcvT domain-containing protein n=1 Tax=Lysobacter koreensis TaxID=266122 RepID=A0ABW2YIX6_9GAMM